MLHSGKKLGHFKWKLEDIYQIGLWERIIMK